MTWAAVAMGAAAVIGAGVNAYGQSQAASSANKAGDAANKQERDQLWYGMMMQKKEELGGGEPLAKWIASNVPQDTKDRLFGTADFQQQVTTAKTGDPRNTRPFVGSRDAGTAETNPQYQTVKGIKGTIDLKSFLNEGGPGYLSQMGDLQKQYGAMGLASENQSRGIEAQAQSFGLGEKSRIERDSALGLKAANRASAAQLAGAGLTGTSLGASAAQGNAVAMQRAKNDAMGSLDDRTLQFMTGLRQNTLNLGLSNQQRNLNLAQAPIAARMGLAGSNAFNPFLNKDTSQFYPGMSPGGTAAQSFGNFMSSGAGTGLGYLSQQQRTANSGSGGVDSSLMGLGGYGSNTGMNPTSQNQYSMNF